MQESDAAGLRVLYERLDTCNGDVAKIKEIIRDSRQGLMSQNFDSLTLVAEVLDDELAPREIAASGRLILLGDGDYDSRYIGSQSGEVTTQGVQSDECSAW